MSTITQWKKKDLVAKDWKDELTGLTIIYRMLECKDQIPINTDSTDYSFIEDKLQVLFNEDLICVSKGQLLWEPTEKAVELRNKMVQVYDQLLKFEIFGNLNLCQDLPEDVSEDGINVFDHCYDPRFQDPEHKACREELNTQDLRIAMISYLQNEMKNSEDWVGGELSPHRLVFFQMLSDGELKGDIWFDLKLGKFFNFVEEVVNTAYPWTSLNDDRAIASGMMKDIYTSGMLEQRKRDGCECSECGIPMAVFEMNAEGQALTICPNPDCGASFNPPEPEGDLYECPNCKADVGTGDHQCRGCGAVLDFSMPEGSVVQETVEETVEDSVWHDPCYDYVPYGYYDPYDPYYDMAAFGLMCCVLW